MKILIVEDERVTRTRILACVKRWGHEGITAEDGEVALRILGEQKIDLVVTDWLMPKMDGVELLKRLRQFEDGSRSLYAILLTSRSDKSDVVEGMEAGANDYVAKPFDEEELRVRVQAGVRIMELENAMREQNRHLAAANRVLTVAHDRMKASLLAAAKIQQSFLPGAAPDFPQARFEWLYEPCEELAGDTLNVVPLDETRVGIYVIDVSGHGVPAALLSVHLSRIMTRLHGPEALLRRQVARDGGWEVRSPAEVASFLNRRFAYDEENQQYFTALYGVLDLESGELRYTSAGHPGPLLVSQGKGQLYEAQPPAIGFVADCEFKEQVLQCGPGDRLYFFSDGVFEVTNGGGEEFGTAGVQRTLEKSSGVPLEQSLRILHDQARAWQEGRPFEDDLSVVGVEMR